MPAIQQSFYYKTLVGLLVLVSLVASSQEDHKPIIKTLASSAKLQGVINPFQADVRYTSYGVPHIKAETYEGLGLGLAYAFATENICLMAEQFITLRGERAKYLGTDGYYHDLFVEALGENVDNVNSDFYHKLIFTDSVAEHQKSGLGVEIQKIVAGWVKGYNKYITENQGKMPKACNNQAWVLPIVEDDLYRRFLQSQMLGGFGTFMKSIVDVIQTEPRKKSGMFDWFSNTNSKLDVDQITQLESMTARSSIGSNALAFGKEMTPNGGGMMFANPHFPWFGSERLYQMHLTIPGEYDIMGSALYGIPFPQIGFNNDIAWSLTWSKDIRYLIRALKLNEDNPTQYYVDGKLFDMNPIEIEVKIKDTDGNLTTEKRIAYKTIYGPLLGGQYFEHSDEQAFAITDYNYSNNRSTQAYFDITQSKTVKQINDALSSATGLPYSNVIAADVNGGAYFSDKSITANVTDEQITRCLTGDRSQFYKDNFGVIILDGSDTSCNPSDDAGVNQSGIIAGSNKPELFRDDYTVQTNDSHWIVNADPASYLTGFPFVIGDEKTPRSERLRVTLDFIEKRKTNEDGLGGTKMTPDHMVKIFYQARLIEAELLKDGLVADCKENPSMRPPWSVLGVDVSKACEVLKNWDSTENINSVGVQIFREFYRNLTGAPGKIKQSVWLNKFDVNNPLTTPNGYLSSRETQAAFAQAIENLETFNIAVDAKLGDIQFLMRNNQKLPISGGQGFHHLILSPTKDKGYTDPAVTGDSYIQAVALTANGPKGYVVNAYSQSVNPDSKHSYDQTVLYSNQNWDPIKFTEDQIQADPNYQLIHLEE